MTSIEVVAAVIIRDHMVFAAQRNGRGEAGFKWEFPGGKLEAGESAGQALVREIDEELGVSIEIGDFLTTVVHDYRDFRLTMHCYLCRLGQGTISLAEHLDSRWLPASQIYSVDWAPADLPVVAMVLPLLVVE